MFSRHFSLAGLANDFEAKRPCGTRRGHEKRQVFVGVAEGSIEQAGLGRHDTSVKLGRRQVLVQLAPERCLGREVERGWSGGS